MQEPFERNDHSSSRGPEGEMEAGRRTIPSDELLKGTREVLIEHAGEFYRLRLTRNGKLILQK